MTPTKVKVRPAEFISQLSSQFAAPPPLHRTLQLKEREREVHVFSQRDGQMKNTWAIVRLDGVQKNLWFQRARFGISISGPSCLQCFSLVSCLCASTYAAANLPRVHFDEAQENEWLSAANPESAGRLMRAQHNRACLAAGGATVWRKAVPGVCRRTRSLAGLVAVMGICLAGLN